MTEGDSGSWEDYEKSGGPETSAAFRAAADAFDLMAAVETEHFDVIRTKNNRGVATNIVDASSILEGIARGWLREGQPRLMDLLHKIIKDWPEAEVDDRWFDLVELCAKHGFGNAQHRVPQGDRSGRFL